MFGERNSIYNLGAGTGLGLNYFVSPQLRLSVAYLADGLEVANPELGLFSGGYSALGQITWSPSDSFSLAATYINDNISITPGLIWLTAPNQDNSNPDALIGTVRTTFKF